jgi:hypothetical protein
MTVQFTNRRDQTYFLHVGQTKAGKPKYCFSRKAQGELATSIPAGFEIYEHPSGQMYLRRITPQVIRDDKLELVEQELQRQAVALVVRVERKGKTITVYASQDDDANRDMLTHMAIPASRHKIDDFLVKSARLSPAMQFILVDKEQRLFQTQRYCYRSSYEGWIDRGSPEPLADLAKSYLQHINQDSYFEL